MVYKNWLIYKKIVLIKEDSLKLSKALRRVKKNQALESPNNNNNNNKTSQVIN